MPGPEASPSRVARIVGRSYMLALPKLLGRPTSPAELRRGVRRFEALAPPGPRRIRTARGQRNGASVDEIAATGTGRHLVYLPGGVFLVRTPRWHRSLFARLCAALDAGGSLVFYRLAPEDPFPAALEDAVDAYVRLLEQGVEATEIVLGGDSAGGGLVLSTLMALRDRGIPLPARAFLLSPMTDLSPARRGSRTSNVATDPLIALTSGVSPHEAYVPDGTAGVDDPLVSPVRGSFAGLPPLLFQVSGSEILLDDSTRAAERARLDGVECSLEVYPGLPHVWQLLPWLPETRAALRSIERFAGIPVG